MHLDDPVAHGDRAVLVGFGTVRDNLVHRGVARSLGMEVKRTAFVHGADALVFEMVLNRAAR